MKKLAAIFALGLGVFFSAFPISSMAAGSSTRKPAMTKPDTSDHCEHDYYGYGHGMMGHGGGMMGGYGMMMESPRMHWVMLLDLSDDQRAKINKLSDELRHNNWEIMGKIQDESDKLRDLYEADKRDPKAIGNEYQKIFDLKRQMIVAMVDTQNKVEALLTPDQLAKLKELRQGHGGMYGYPMH